MSVRSVAGAIALLTLVGAPARAQLDPAAHWRTLRTEHFRVHYAPPLEDQARRAAANAEQAWSRLAAELVPPRGPVDLLLSDDVDFTNGYATPVPSNRIVVYAHPPVDTRSLRFYDDWSTLVITHELAHIFHLDRSRGWWRAAQRVFGRNELLFPNQYLPAWLVEGLAVYYESRLTGSGRLEGSDHRLTASAAANAGRLPRLGDISAATSAYPGGGGVYVYGSLLFDYLAATRGAAAVPKFVERTSRQTVPFFLDRAARGSFGVSLSGAWRAYADSLARAASPLTAPLPGWRELTRDGRDVNAPRWLSDTRIVYGANTGRETPGAYETDVDGHRKRRGRRNGLDAGAPLAGGGLVFAQLDYTDPYHLRSDLYLERGGHTTRLTRGARLTTPDARLDGSIVAVQAVPGGTRLVRVTSTGSVITTISLGSEDEQWAEPRWSPDGRRIAAVHWRRGGLASVVVTDTAGAPIAETVPVRAVVSAPSWSPDGRAVLFSSDAHDRRPQLFRIVVPDDSQPVPARLSPARVSGAATGLFDPQLSPDGRWLAAVMYRADGYHIGIAPWPTGLSEPADEIVPRPPLAPPVRAEGATVRYSPWRSLLPRSWSPYAGTDDRGGLMLGALTSGADIVGRHAYAAQAFVGTDTRDLSASLGYRYAGLGRPVLDFSALQEWEYFDITNTTGATVGELARRTRLAAAIASVTRRRVRTVSWLSLGGQVEAREYSTDPEPLLGDLDARFAETPVYPAVLASAGFGNTQRPLLAISPEDGVSLSTTVRQRWRARDRGTATRSVVGVGRAYKSLDLPGFAHHVIAVRAAGGLADARATSTFSVGGTSGGLLELPGYTVGEGERTFGVRGFVSGAARGTRAVAGTVEYRAPLAMPSRGIGKLPFFVDRASLALFGDAGEAWCQAAAAALCGLADRQLLASVGGELALDTALQYDSPFRFRFGVAVPVAGRERARRDAALYVSFGTLF